MCGIYGCVGTKNAVTSAIAGLQKLEYRGYDSAGIAYINGKNKIEIVKALGNVENLKNQVNEKVFSRLSIAHTRWATHGKTTLENCHPHFSENFVLVHNGIIENFEELKNEINEKTYSETDSEIIVKLIEKIYKNFSNNSMENDKKILFSIKKATEKMKGSWAVILLCKNNPKKMFVFKNKSPLILATNNKESIVASDINAINGDEKSKFKYYNLNDFNIAEISDNNIKIYDKNLKKIKLKEIKKQCEIINLNNNYKHKMIKEINEIPFAICETKKRIKNKDFKKLISQMPSFSQITIVGCGTAYHAGLYGKYIFEKYLGVNVNVELASEYRYKTQIKNENELVIAISQSGETADTLAAIEIAKKKGAKTAVITNVCSSTITRMCDYVILTHAGTEVAVAATKSYITQILALYMLAYKTINKRISKNIGQVAKTIIDLYDYNFFKSFEKMQKFFFIGRLCDSASAQEASLKLKEIAYVHSEGYPAGELKHGTLSLVDDNSLVVAIITQKSVLEKTLNAVHEVRARGAKVIVLSQFDDEIKNENLFKLPKANEDIMPLFSILPLQLFAYNFSLSKGLNPDMPKNLAKSVTVE